MQDEDAELYRAALHEIIGLATDLGRRIHAAAAAEPEPTLTLEQASIALDRTARTLRRTILLARRLHQLPASSGQDRTAARKQVIRGVEDAIHRAARDTPDHHEALCAELEERLDRPDFEADLATRPIPDLIEELARDLGVAIQGRSWIHRRRTPADIEHLLARALRHPGPLPRGEGRVREQRKPQSPVGPKGHKQSPLPAREGPGVGHAPAQDPIPRPPPRT